MRLVSIAFTIASLFSVTTVLAQPINENQCIGIATKDLQKERPNEYPFKSVNFDSSKRYCMVIFSKFVSSSSPKCSGGDVGYKIIVDVINSTSIKAQSFDETSCWE